MPSGQQSHSSLRALDLLVVRRAVDMTVVVVGSDWSLLGIATYRSGVHTVTVVVMSAGATVVDVTVEEAR